MSQYKWVETSSKREYLTGFDKLGYCFLVVSPIEYDPTDESYEVVGDPIWSNLDQQDPRMTPEQVVFQVGKMGGTIANSIYQKLSSEYYGG